MDDEGNEYEQDLDHRKKKVRFHSWVSEKESKRYKDLSDIKAAQKTELVSVGEGGSGFAYKLSLSGVFKSQLIAEKDMENQEDYLFLSKPTKLLFDSFFSLLQELNGTQKLDPVLVTSLVRSLQYQAKVSSTNGQASKNIMTHCNGIAFDMIKPTNKKLLSYTLFTVSEHRSVSYMSDAPEGNGTVHIAGYAFDFIPVWSTSVVWENGVVDVKPGGFGFPSLSVNPESVVAQGNK
jgi:hypothetical protein